jgi:hypothetical protein
VAANRIGAHVLLLNTSFAGPALVEVAQREDVDAVVYDEEFTSTVDGALADKPDAIRIVAWTDKPSPHERTVEACRRRSGTAGTNATQEFSIHLNAPAAKHHCTCLR